MKIRNKKGNAVADGAIILVVLFIFGLIATLGFSVFSDLNSEIQADNTLSNESKAISDDLHTTYPGLFDGLFIFIVVALWMSAIIFAMFVDAHPIFLVISIFLVIFVLVLAAYLGNAYGVIVSADELATISTSFPMSNFVMSHLVETILVILSSVMIALYAKNR